MSRKRKKRKSAPPVGSGPVPDDQGQIPFRDEGGPTAAQTAAAKAYAATSASEPAVDTVAADAAEAPVVPASALRDAEAKRDEYLTLAQKTQAEFENYRKRVQREMGKLKRESLGDFLKEFFSAFDDLDRALAEGEKKHDYDVFHDGVRLVRENLWKVMEKVGVKPIEALGQAFDPTVHEALTTVPSAEHEPNTVLEVFQPGYTLDDFVLRPAKVVVSVAPPAAQEE